MLWPFAVVVLIGCWALVLVIGGYVGLATVLLPGERRAALGLAGAFFEGAGYAYREVISLIVVANCFSTGVKGIGLGLLVDRVAGLHPLLIVPLPAASRFSSRPSSCSGRRSGVLR